MDVAEVLVAVRVCHAMTEEDLHIMRTHAACPCGEDEAPAPGAAVVVVEGEARQLCFSADPEAVNDLAEE